MLSEEDRELLNSYKPLVHAIADQFGRGCEVLLHSLEDLQESIIMIANGHVTGRSLGSPMTDLGIRLVRECSNTTAQESSDRWTYFTRTTDARPLKSTSVIIRNSAGAPIGMLCINLDLSTPVSELIADFTPESLSVSGEVAERSVMSVEQLVEKSIGEVVESISTDRSISNAVKNKKIVSELQCRGIFDIKGAIDMVARELNVSRYTIYNYIRESK